MDNYEIKGEVLVLLRIYTEMKQHSIQSHNFKSIQIAKKEFNQ